MMSKIKAYIGELLKSVQMVSDVMEGLVKRVTVEESEIVVRKNKVTLSQEKIRRKAIQIERMSSKFEEMMQQRVEESFSKASEGSQKNKNIRTEQGGDRDDSFPARKTQLSYRFEH
jgi:DNA integrity scanning protein DisA with diadenylate cyclase activity